MARTSLIDLDAARREAEVPENLPVVFQGEEFLLPAELPADAFDSLLSEDLDLVGLIKPFLEEGVDYGDVVMDLLTERPDAPASLIGAVHGVFESLFGADDYAAFRDLRPSLRDYSRLSKGLMEAYGIDLGEAFASPASSESAGATPKPTSQPSTDSTSETSGEQTDNSEASSDSAA